MFFRDIPGYTSLKKRLVSLANSGRIPHGLLFDMADGMPGIHLAWAWAQYINCTQRTPEDSCGVCPACRKTAALMHPDLFFSFPVVNASQESNPCDLYMSTWRQFLQEKGAYIAHSDWINYIEAENSQPTIYVKEIESIIEKLSTSISEGGYRIVIIYQPDRMNESAANKLLKHLEEPPDRTLFFNVCFRSELLLDTIISRLQTIEIPQLSSVEIRRILALHYPSASEKDIEQASQLAMGNPGVALSIMSHGAELTEIRSLVTDVFQLMLARNTASLKKLADDFSSQGREWCVRFLSQMTQLVQQLLQSRLTEQAMQTAELYENKVVLASIFRLLSPALAGRIYALTESAIKDIRGNVLTKLVLFNTFTLMTQHIQTATKQIGQ